jgi:hypothetical protein
MPTLKLRKDKVTGMRTDASIVEAKELINYLLRNTLNPKVAFKKRFEKVFDDNGQCSPPLLQA